LAMPNSSFAKTTDKASDRNIGNRRSKNSARFVASQQPISAPTWCHLDPTSLIGKVCRTSNRSSLLRPNFQPLVRHKWDITHREPTKIRLLSPSHTHFQVKWIKDLSPWRTYPWS